MKQIYLLFGIWFATILLAELSGHYIEINKKWNQYPCYYVSKSKKYCGGGTEAQEILLSKLNSGEWRVDFQKSQDN